MPNVFCQQKSRSLGVVWLLVAFALLALTVTNDSLWLDEGPTAAYARQGSFSGWVSHLKKDTCGDCQMPLGMFSAWAVAPLLGTGEYQLRSVNFFWGALALLLLFLVGRWAGVTWVPALFAIQPFFVFYMNEARPYMPQIAAGCLLLVAAVAFVREQGRGLGWATLFVVAVNVFCLTTLMAPFTIMGVVLSMAVLAYRERWKISFKSLAIIFVGFLCTLPIGAYYGWTILRGAKGAKIWDISPLNAGYVIYELLGCTGLGPAINTIRAVAKSELSLSLDNVLQLATSALLLLVIFSVFSGAILVSRKPKMCGLLLYFLAAFFISVLVVLVTGIPLGKAFWARHLSGAFPFYVFALALALQRLFEEKKPAGIVAAALLAILLCISSLSLRMAPRHVKEDYRGAAREANAAAARGKNVWWVAGTETGHYYGLAFEGNSPGPSPPPRVAGRQSSSALPTDAAPLPDVIFITRPDVHDPDGYVGRLIASGTYQLRRDSGHFSVWEKSEQ
ncbi:MAG: hypothetical protein WCI20_12355 [bacterium]